MWNNTVRMANSRWTQNSFTPRFNNSSLSLSSWANTDVMTIRGVVLLPLPCPLLRWCCSNRETLSIVWCEQTDCLPQIAKYVVETTPILPCLQVWLNKDENMRCPFLPHWGGEAGENENHMRKYTPVRGVKCVHERRNSNQIGFLWQTITFILNQQHFSQAQAVAPMVIRARLVLAPGRRDVAT